MDPSAWPALPYDDWQDTRDTLHMYLQIVGKVRHVLSPPEPDWGHAPLYLTARGLNTSPIPHPTGGTFDIDVDLADHVLSVRTVRGPVERIPLEPRTVAAFYGELMDALGRLGVPAEIATNPSDVAEGIPFPDDDRHASYEREWAHRFWQVLVRVRGVLAEHRARFAGRVTPVQLWWGSLDLAYARHAGDDQYAAGFWPGDRKLPEPAFYAYALPKPDGVDEEPGWNAALDEFILPYDTVREGHDPRRELLGFLDRTYAVSGCAG